MTDLMGAALSRRNMMLGLAAGTGLAVAGPLLGVDGMPLPSASAAEPTYGWVTIPGIGRVRSLPTNYSRVTRKSMDEVRYGDKNISAAQRWQPGTSGIHYNSATAPLYSYPYGAPGSPVVDVLHPTYVTSCVIDLIDNFLKSGDRAWLNRAMRITQFLHDDADVVQSVAGPARFPAYRYHDQGVRTNPNPWYSSFGVSRMLHVTSKLYYLTKDAKWARMAKEYLNAYTVPRNATNPQATPWISGVIDGFLYYEKDPRSAFGALDNMRRAYNGMSSGFYGIGIYDELVGGNELSKALASAFFATVRHSWPSCRVVGEPSRYDMVSEGRNLTYHSVNTASFGSMWNLTGDPFYADGVHRLSLDYPNNAVSALTGERYMALVERKHHLIRTGTVNGTASAPITWLQPGYSFHTTVSSIHRWPGESSTWLRMTKGERAGWWIMEEPGLVMLGAPLRGAGLRGDALDRLRPAFRSFSARPLPIVFRAGQPITAYTYDWYGKPTGVKRGRWLWDSNTAADAMAHINGRLHVRISAGVFKGMWVPLEDPLVKIKDTPTVSRITFVGRPLVTACRWDGVRLSSAFTSRVREGSTVRAEGPAWFKGRPWLYVLEGMFAGRWVPLNRSTRFSI